MAKSSEKQEKKQSKLKFVAFNMPTSLYQQIKDMSVSNGVTFTAQIINLVRDGLKQEKALELMPKMLEQLLEEKQRNNKRVRKTTKKE